MEKEDRGECSRKNEFPDDGKPLKKARYVWEVKGKHHLKEHLSNNNNIEEPEAGKGEEKSCSSTKCCSNKPKETATSSSSTASPNNRCCIEFFLAKTEAIMDSDCDDDMKSSKHLLENVIQNEIPVTLVSSQPKNQDYYLRKWQARQIARGFVDNTINSVLETWANPPFDAVDFVENCENDGQIEDDAILMAIQSHGLQSGGTFANFAGENSRTQESIEEFTSDNLQNFNKEQETSSGASISSVDSMSIDTNSTEDSSSGNIQYDSISMGDPMDFLNAAVSVAIQKKGLSYS